MRPQNSVMMAIQAVAMVAQTHARTKRLVITIAPVTPERTAPTVHRTAHAMLTATQTAVLRGAEMELFKLRMVKNAKKHLNVLLMSSARHANVLMRMSVEMVLPRGRKIAMMESVAIVRGILAIAIRNVTVGVVWERGGMGVLHHRKVF